MTAKDKGFADEYLEWEERVANNKASGGPHDFRTERRESLEAVADDSEDGHQRRIRWRRKREILDTP